MRIARVVAMTGLLSFVSVLAQAPEDAPEAETISAGSLLNDVAADVPAPRKDVRATVFPIVKYREDGDSKRVKLVDVVVGEGYSYKRDGEHREVEVIHLPLVSVLKTERDPGSDSVKILDIPFFTLAESSADADGDFDHRAIDIPIFGPLFRHRRSGDEEKVRFLIFSHTRKTGGGLDQDDAGHTRVHPRQGR